MTTDKSQEVRLFSPEGERLYLTAQERKHFLAAAEEEDRENKLFCHTLFYTGCRPSEALELSPGRISMDEKEIVFRSLIKRKKASRGRKKLPEFRAVPVPKALVDGFDYVFDIRRKQRKNMGLKDMFWTMSRPTAYRLVKRVMQRAKNKEQRTKSKYQRETGHRKRNPPLFRNHPFIGIKTSTDSHTSSTYGPHQH